MLHEDFSNSYRVMAQTRVFGKLNKEESLGIKEMGKHAFLCVTRRPVQIHIPIKLHEDILNKNVWKKIIKGAKLRN